MSVHALIFAGGVGDRFQSSRGPKQYDVLNGREILVHTISRFQTHSDIDNLVVICPTNFQDLTEELVRVNGLSKVCKVLAGGRDTLESKTIGLEWMIEQQYPGEDLVLLHDGVRPLVSHELISANIACARRFSNAVSVRPVHETMVVSTEGLKAESVVPREGLWVAVAPQTFQLGMALEIHRKAAGLPESYRRDASLLCQALGIPIYLVADDSTNIKVTYPEDRVIAEAILNYQQDEVGGDSSSMPM